MKKLCALAFAVVAGCENKAGVTGWPFDPVQFFAGHTHGEARLRLITGVSRRVSVDSIGNSDGRGGLVLDQAIREDGQARRVRRWTIQPAGPSHWTGTLTDAVGPVDVRRTTTDVTIRYRMKSGPEVEQHLQLPPGGQAWNHMTISRFGIKVASLDEQIRKVRQ